ncbi:unnamed protein product [Leptidea sinapis]|uniref:DUF19 domain-containing protein n=1 Tax=Leptidea sinapis TaxID=189913 RepID=A0A5E4QUA3_9NEOP|nr:unnamed protein product [Leptidea sinapis]
MTLPVLSSPDISFALTREELDKSCIELQSGIKCIYNYIEQCMDKSEQIMFRRIYAGITDVVQDLCTRGSYQDEYLRHADCVKTVRSEYETCSKNYEVTLTSLSNHQKKDQYETDGASHDDYLRTVCCSFQEYLTCSERTVQRTCGDEAALFTSAFLKRMASNIIKNFCSEYREQECSLADGAKTSHFNVLLLLISTLVTLIPYMSSLVPA